MTTGKFIIGLLIVALFSGCTMFKEVSNKTVDTTDGDIYVWHDDEEKVTCWIFRGAFKGGISCIPDSQLQIYTGDIKTKLGEDGCYTCEPDGCRNVLCPPPVRIWDGD